MDSCRRGGTGALLCPGRPPAAASPAPAEGRDARVKLPLWLERAHGADAFRGVRVGVEAALRVEGEKGTGNRSMPGELGGDRVVQGGDNGDRDRCKLPAFVWLPNGKGSLGRRAARHLPGLCPAAPGQSRLMICSVRRARLRQRSNLTRMLVVDKKTRARRFRLASGSHRATLMTVTATRQRGSRCRGFRIRELSMGTHLVAPSSCKNSSCSQRHAPRDTSPTVACLHRPVWSTSTSSPGSRSSAP